MGVSEYYLLYLQITTHISWTWCQNSQEYAYSDLGKSQKENFYYVLEPSNLSNNTMKNYRVQNVVENNINDNERSNDKKYDNLFNDYHRTLDHNYKRDTQDQLERGHGRLFDKPEISEGHLHSVRRKIKEAQTELQRHLNKKYKGTSLYENGNIKYSPKLADNTDDNLKTNRDSAEPGPVENLEIPSQEENVVEEEKLKNGSGGEQRNKNYHYKAINTVDNSSKERKRHRKFFKLRDNSHKGGKSGIEGHKAFKKPKKYHESGSYLFQSTGNSEKNIGFIKNGNAGKMRRVIELQNKEKNQKNPYGDVLLHSFLDANFHLDKSLNEQDKSSNSDNAAEEQSNTLARMDEKSGLTDNDHGKDPSVGKLEVKGHDHPQSGKKINNQALISQTKIPEEGNNLVNHGEVSNINSGFEVRDKIPHTKKKPFPKPKPLSMSNSKSNLSDTVNPNYEYDSGVQDDTNNLDTGVNMNQDVANTRNQRDIKKRLSKHNKHPVKLDNNNVFHYLEKSDENDDLDETEFQKYENSVNEREDDSEKYHSRNFDVNSNNNDKYSYKEPEEEETEAVNGEENSNRKEYSKKHFSQRSHEPKQKNEQINDKEKCVAYKVEKVTEQPTTCAVTTTEKCTTKLTTCTAKTTPVKTKATTQACSKPPPTKKCETDRDESSAVSGTSDVFEQFLCGQLADDFVDAVIAKVKRSRKIYKELGFRNDSEDSCDRCLETKPSKLPDRECMKTAMGKCSKCTEHRPNCYTCYSVPKPMDKFLSLLVLYEKEHENSVYNKIRDDSSFIFTGDYPEQFNQHDNEIDNNFKFSNDRSSLSKSTFEKEHLIEENNQEKHDDETESIKASENVKHTSEIDDKEKEVDYSTKTKVGKNKNLNKISDTQSSVHDEMKNNDVSFKNQAKSSLELDEKVDDHGLEDELDMNVPLRNKYSPDEDLENSRSDESLDTASIKQRRKAFKSDVPLSPKTPLQEPDVIPERNMKVLHLGGRNLGQGDNALSTFRSGYGSEHLLPHEHNDLSKYGQIRHHQIPRQHKDGWNRAKNNRQYHLNSLLKGKYSNGVNDFRYPGKEYKNENELVPFQNNGRQHSVANGFMNSDWENSEYQLIPNPPDRTPEHNLLKTDPRRRFYNNDYEENLNMVKRESEPSYEDEPLFIEIPNIEYDLY